MVNTLKWLLDSGLTQNEMRGALSVMCLQLEESKGISTKKISELSGLDLNSCRIICRNLVAKNVIKVTDEKEVFKSTKYFAIVSPWFYREKRPEVIIDSGYILEEIKNSDHLEEQGVKDYENNDAYLEYSSADLLPEKHNDDGQIALLKRAANRRITRLSEDSFDPIESLKIAKQNRGLHVKDQDPPYVVFNKRIQIDNDTIVDAMRNKYKSLKDYDSKAILVLYALKFHYPDVGVQHMRVASKPLERAILECIEILGFDEVIQAIMGRRIAFNGTNFLKYWTRQFKNMPKYKKEGNL